MQITKDSHLDHGLTPEQIAFIRETFLERSSFFIETITLPEELGTVECKLVGPATGSIPVMQYEVVYEQRGERAWPSRIAPRRKPARSRLVTVVAGPHGDDPCVLYTAYGGPQAPREPGDPAIETAAEMAASRAFWHDHALTR